MALIGQQESLSEKGNSGRHLPDDSRWSSFVSLTSFDCYDGIGQGRRTSLGYTFLHRQTMLPKYSAKCN